MGKVTAALRHLLTGETTHQVGTLDRHHKSRTHHRYNLQVVLFKREGRSNRGQTGPLRIVNSPF